MSEESWSTCSRCNTTVHCTSGHGAVLIPDSLHAQPDPDPGSHRDVLPLVMADYQARMAHFAAPAYYGQPLRIDNLRDHLRDAYEEALDQTGYLKAAMVLWDEMRATMQQVHRLCTEVLEQHEDAYPWIARKQYRAMLQGIAHVTAPYQS